MINLCEAKYSASEYTLTKEESMKLLNRMGQFQRETAIRKGIFITLITTNGLNKNRWHDTANAVITMNDLFR